MADFEDADRPYPKLVPWSTGERPVRPGPAPEPRLLTAELRRDRFVDAYLRTLNATEAAREAGYGGEHPERAGYALLRDPRVLHALAERRREEAAAARLTATRVLEELGRLALVDARSFFHADGSLKAMTELTPEQGAAVASFEVIIKNAQAGDGETDTIHKLKFWDKTKALELLAKHLRLLVDRVEVGLSPDLAAAIAEGRQRAAARNRKVE